MKKVIVSIAAGALLAGAIVSTAFAQTPNWLADFKRADFTGARLHHLPPAGGGLDAQL